MAADSQPGTAVPLWLVLHRVRWMPWRLGGVVASRSGAGTGSARAGKLALRFAEGATTVGRHSVGFLGTATGQGSPCPYTEWQYLLGYVRLQ
jgi:hypothetical protein